MASGVYKIENLVNGKLYIGSSKVIGHRLSVHKSQLKKGAHPNAYLQNSWNKHGEQAFSFAIIEECLPEKAELEALEQKYIDLLGSHKLKQGYNIRPKASNNTGAKFSEQAKLRMSIAKTGTSWSEAKRASMAGKSSIPHKRGWKQPAERALKYRKPVLQFTADGQFLAEYTWCGEAAMAAGCSENNIRGACSQGYKAKNFLWKFK